MERKLIFVKGEYLDDINYLLKDGWQIEQIVPVAYPGFLGRCGDKDGFFGAYVSLIRPMSFIN